MRTLIIGYGNRNRRDDGVGWFVLEQLAAFPLPGIELQTLHQLEVELAETLAILDTVVFVDAGIPESPAEIQRTEVVPHMTSHAVAHYLTPQDLLALSVTLYGHQPRAVLFTIRGQDFNFGTTLTPAVEAAGRTVVEEIRKFLASLSNPGAPAALTATGQD